VPSARTFGVDEAGRGPILGPMALAVVAVDRHQAARLTRAGVTDSKRFGAGARAREARAELARIVRDVAAAYCVQLVDTDTIDRHVFRGELNHLERNVAARLLTRLGAGVDASARDRIICDGRRMFAPLATRFPGLRAVDRGESVHVAVAAASILAKDARDEAFAAIAGRYRDEFGPIEGGGYLNAATRAFLNAYARRYGGLPPEARRSWGTGAQAELFGA
jgi:ribonuclease HII